MKRSRRQVSGLAHALCPTEEPKTTRVLSGTADHFHPPSIAVFTFRSEKVHVILELQLEDVILVDIITFCWHCNGITQQGQTGQWKIVLKSLVEKEAEVGKHNPEFLPSIAVLELA